MAVTIDNEILRRSDNPGLAKYFQTLLKDDSQRSKQISKHLLQAVEVESIAPRIFSIWLSVCDKPHCIADALQSNSVSVRRLALRRAGKWIHSKRFIEIWTALGDTSGILTLMSTFSISEVKEFCLSLGRASTADAEREVRRARISELLHSLAYEQFPDAKYENPETRRIAKYYRPIVEACDPATRIAWLDNETLPKLRQDDDTKARIIFDNTIDSHSSREISVQLEPSKLYPTLRNPSGLDFTNGGHWHGVSKDMLFSIQKLWELQETSMQKQSSKGVPDHITKYATTLLRRLCRKKCSTPLVIDVLNILIKIFMVHPDTTTQIGIRARSIVAYIARIWSRRKSQELWQKLQTILQFAQTNSDLSEVTRLLEVVHIADRPRFLRLLLQHLSAHKFDIDLDEELKNRKLYWPYGLFLCLPPKYAKSLLQRVIQTSVHENPVSFAGTGSDTILNLNQRNDPVLLSLKLSSDEAWVRQTAQQVIDKAKQEAIKCREQSDRADWVQRILVGAIASRDGDVFTENLVWVRRYSKDPLTVKSLYSSWLHASEVIDLIAGIPSRAEFRSMEELAKAVDRGNKAMSVLIETAYKAILEPSFQYFDWKHVQQVPALVLVRRLSMIHDLQSAPSFSSDLVYDAVWRSTLNTLISIETSNLDEQHEGLKWQGPTDIIGSNDILGRFDRSKPIPSATLLFLDTFTRQRNELWVQKRLQQNPAMHDVPRHFPKGLPIQYLLPRSNGVSSHGETITLICKVPYVFDRAKQIVFVNAVHEEVPSAEETQAAIASFVESYETALAYYIYAHDAGPEREAAILQAWTHATGPLTDGKLSPPEAIKFWYTRFSRVCPLPKLPQDASTQLELPKPDDSDELIEWNPDPDYVKAEKKDAVKAVTVLDCLLYQGYSTFSSGTLNDTTMWAAKSSSDFHTPSHRVTPWVNTNTVWSHTPRSKEAIAAAALLLVAEKIAADSNILNMPFPSRSDPRYPAMYLDNDFLERKELKESIALSALSPLWRDLPTELLLSIARMLRPKLADPKLGSTVADIYEFFNRLGDTHMPWKFIDLHLDLIFGRPEDSGWHRQLLKKALLNNLPVLRAKQAIADILTAIEQSYEGQKKAKITTLKQFASLIATTDCVDQTTSVQALLLLLAQSKHIDVRVAVVTGLIEIFKDTDNAIKATIIDGFQTHAVAMAASINERQVISEVEWTKAETDAKAPEPSEDMVSPLTECFMQLARTKGISEVDRRSILYKVLLPIVQQWSSNVRRWSRIFLAEHGLRLSDDMLAHALPSTLTGRLLDDHIEYLPKSFLDEHVDRNFALDNEPAELKVVMKHIKASADLRRTEQVKFWMRAWGTAGAELTQERLPKLLTKEWKSKVEAPEVPITYNHVQVIVRRVVEDLIMRRNVDKKKMDADTTTTVLLVYISHMNPSHLSDDSKVAALKLTYVRPIVEWTIRRIDELRTPAWQRDPARIPRVLPDTFELRTWLLPYPGYNTTDSGETMASQCLSFAEDVRGLMREITSSQRLYTSKYDKITAAAKRAKACCKLRVALDLVNECPEELRDLTLADRLCFDLANTLLEQAQKPFDADDIPHARAVVSRWTESFDEDIRNMGAATERAIESDVSSRKYSNWSYGSTKHHWADGSCELPVEFAWNTELTKRRRLVTSRRRFTLHDTSSMAMAERDYYFRRLAAFTAWQK